jgi:hypothetical protein
VERRPTMHLVIEGEKASNGKTPFTAFWMQHERRRAQCFNADLDEFLKRGVAVVHETEEEARIAAWGATT